MCKSIPAASIPPRANHRAYPGHLKKISNARPCRQFLLTNARPPVPSVVVKCPALQSIWSIYKIISCHILINITVSDQKNCIKNATKWVTPTEKRQSKWFYCFKRSFMVDKCSSPTPKWQCLTAWNPWLWAPSEMTTGCSKQVCCCLQIPGGPGHY